MAVNIKRRAPEVPDDAPAATLLRQCFAFAPDDRPTAAIVSEELSRLEQAQLADSAAQIAAGAAQLEKLQQQVCMRLARCHG